MNKTGDFLKRRHWLMMLMMAKKKKKVFLLFLFFALNLKFEKLLGCFWIGKIERKIFSFLDFLTSASVSYCLQQPTAIEGSPVSVSVYNSPFSLTKYIFIFYAFYVYLFHLSILFYWKGGEWKKKKKKRK